jgi:YD repeat-containing protein
MSFEQNCGQTDARVRYFAHGRGYGIFLTQDEAVFALRGGSSLQEELRSWRGRDRRGRGRAPVPMPAIESSVRVLRMQLVGANRGSGMSGEGRLRGRVSYFVGRDPKAWRRNLPTFGRVRRQGVYRGVDLVYYGNQQRMEYDFVVSPFADPGAIRFKFTGASRPRVNAAGDLVLGVGGRDLVQRAPAVYQTIRGRRVSVAGKFLLLGKDSSDVGFKIARYDRSLPLVIDPVLIYSSLIGTAGSTTGTAIAVGSGSGGSAVYVTGSTSSADFPVAGTASTYAGGTDAFVSEFDMTQSGAASLVYSTFIGGSAADQGAGIAVDSSGTIYVAGTTLSQDFPTFPSPSVGGTMQPLFGLPGTQQAFLVCMSSGGGLVYSTFLVGQNGTSPYTSNAAAVACDNSGNAFVTGTTTAPASLPDWSGFRTTASLTGSQAQTCQAFVMEVGNVSGAATLQFSTLLGGAASNSATYGNGIAVAPINGGNEQIYVTGATSADDFPAAGGSGTAPSADGQPVGLGGMTTAFVARLDPTVSGNPLVYSAYLGRQEQCYGVSIAADTAGNAYIAGYSDPEGNSPQYPLKYAFQSVPQCGECAVVTRLDTTKSGAASLVYSTYLGGQAGFTDGMGIATDGAGKAYVAGLTGLARADGFPVTTAAYQNSYNGILAGFISIIDTNDTSGVGGTSLVYSTYLSGSTCDACTGIAVDGQGLVYVTGMAGSSDFPTTASGFQPQTNVSFGTLTSMDGFVAQIDPTQGPAGLLYGSYLGGGSDTYGLDMAIDGNGDVFITGKADTPESPLGNLGGRQAEQVSAFVAEIDPTGTQVLGCGFLQGTGSSTGYGIALDTSGNVYVAGQTNCQDFPIIFQDATGTASTVLQPDYPGSQPGLTPANTSGFLAVVNFQTGDFIYSTYLGGTNQISPSATADTQGYGVATYTDASGNVYAYVSGSTTAAANGPTATAAGGSGAAFPLFNSLGEMGSSWPGGGSEAFVAKINMTPALNLMSPGPPALAYSTLLGGNGSSDAASIAVDGSGLAYVGGSTNSTNFPTAGPFQSANAGGYDLTLSVINDSGGQPVLKYSTYFGGSQDDHAIRIAVDGNGRAFLTGCTDSTDLPTSAGAFQTAMRGSANALVVCLNTAASSTASLVYSTYLGGTWIDYGIDIAVDSQDNAFVTGLTYSWDFPTLHPIQAQQGYFIGNSGQNLNVTSDAFVTEVNPAGTSLVYSTYLGGSGNDAGWSIKLDAADDAYITGSTTSPDFPVTNAVLASFDGSVQDVFVAKLAPGGTQDNDQLALSYISLNSPAIVGGGSVTGTVHLTGVVPIGSSVPVRLSTSVPQLVTIMQAGSGQPTSVIVVPCGASSADFTIQTKPVTQPTQVNVTGVYNAPASAPLIVLPTGSGPNLKSVSLNSSTVIGGNTVQGTVTLTDVATSPVVVAVVAVSRQNPGVAAFPGGSWNGYVVVPSGSASANFTLNTQMVTVPTSAVVIAYSGTVWRWVPLTILPGSSSMTIDVDPSTLNGGRDTGRGTVTLANPAPAPGLTVALGTDQSQCVSFSPNAVTIPANGKSAQFTVHTQAVAQETLATVTGAAGSLNAATQIEIEPPSLTSFVILPSSDLDGCTTAYGVVTISCPAPPGGAVVQLSTGNQSLFPLPPSVTIPAGKMQIQFPVVVGSPGTQSVNVSVNARYGNDGVGDGLTIYPCQSGPCDPAEVGLLGITLPPNGFLPGTTATGTVFLSDNILPGGQLIDIAVSTPPGSPNCLIVPQSVFVSSCCASFPIQTTQAAMSISSSIAYTITASYHNEGIGQSQSLVLNPLPSSGQTGGGPGDGGNSQGSDGPYQAGTVDGYGGNLTLTPSAYQAGFRLTTFASAFPYSKVNFYPAYPNWPNTQNVVNLHSGAAGAAVAPDGGVLITTFGDIVPNKGTLSVPGNEPRFRFPVDTDGQVATGTGATASEIDYTSATPPNISGFGIAASSTAVYMAPGYTFPGDTRAPVVLKINNDGSLGTAAIVWQSPNLGTTASPIYASPDGMAVNPANGHLLLAVNVTSLTGPTSIADIDPNNPDPTTNTRYILAPPSLASPNAFATDGLAVTPDGSTVYVVDQNANVVRGFSVADGTPTFVSAPLPTTMNLPALMGYLAPVDGIACGTGSIGNTLVVNCNDGNVYSLDLVTGNFSTLATGGAFGDFTQADPNGTLFLSQGTRVMRLIPPAGGGFATVSRQIFTRDDLTPYIDAEGNAHTYAAFGTSITSINGSYVGNIGCASPAATFDLTGIDPAANRVVAANMLRTGAIQWIGTGSADLQLGFQSPVTSDLYYGPTFEDVESAANDNPYGGDVFNPGAWDLPPSFFPDLQQALGDEVAYNLVDQLSSGCGVPAIVDQPTAFGSSSPPGAADVAFEKNVLTFESAPSMNPQASAGRCVDITLPGADAPVNPVSGGWDIVQNGVVVACAGNPNGWGVEPDYTEYGGVNISVPAVVEVDAAYEVRTSFGAAPSSGCFTVTSSPTETAPVLLPLQADQLNLAPGAKAQVTVTLDAPAPAGCGAVVPVEVLSAPAGVQLLDASGILPLPNGNPNLDPALHPSGSLVIAGAPPGTTASASFFVSAPASVSPGSIVVAVEYNGIRRLTLSAVGTGQAPGQQALSLLSVGPSMVQLGWAPLPGSAGGTPASYNVYRSLTHGGPYTPIYVGIPAPVATFTDTSATNLVAYYYVVTAVNAYGEGPPSNEVATTPPAGSGVSPPTILPSSGAYKDAVLVSMQDAMPQTVIHYVVSQPYSPGGSPAQWSPDTVYRASFALANPNPTGGQDVLYQVNAYAVGLSGAQSAVTSAEYRLTANENANADNIVPLHCNEMITGTPPNGPDLSANSDRSVIKGPAFYADHWPVLVQAGKAMDITVSSSSFAPVLYLFDPTGLLVGSAIGTVSGNAELIYNPPGSWPANWPQTPADGTNTREFMLEVTSLIPLSGTSTAQWYYSIGAACQQGAEHLSVMVDGVAQPNGYTVGFDPDTPSHTIMLENTGAAGNPPIDIASCQLQGSYQLDPALPPSLQLSGQSAWPSAAPPATLSVDENALGIVQGALTLNSNDADNPTFTLNLTGRMTGNLTCSTSLLDMLCQTYSQDGGAYNITSPSAVNLSGYYVNAWPIDPTLLGQTVTFTMFSSTFAPAIYLVQPNQTSPVTYSLAGSASAVGGNTAQFTVTLPSSGTYLLLCTSAGPGVLGSFMLDVSCDSGQSALQVLVDGQQIDNNGSVQFETVTGVPVSHTFTLDNNGAAPIDFSGLSYGGDYSAGASPAPQIPPGGQVSFPMVLKADPSPPVDTSQYSTTLQILNDSANANPFNVQLVGIVNPGVALASVEVNPSTLQGGNPTKMTFHLSGDGSAVLGLAATSSVTGVMPITLPASPITVTRTNGQDPSIQIPTGAVGAPVAVTVTVTQQLGSTTYTDPVVITVVPQPLSVQINQPASGPLTPGMNSTPIGVSVGGPSGPITLTLAADGKQVYQGAVSTGYNSAPYMWTGLSNGTHVAYATVTSGAGSASTSATFTVGAAPAAPTITPTVQNSSARISIVDNDSPNAAIYYTTDGTQPGIGSTLYAEPFYVTNTTAKQETCTVNAVACDQHALSIVATKSVTLSAASTTPLAVHIQSPNDASTITQVTPVAATISGGNGNINWEVDYRPVTQQNTARWVCMGTGVWPLAGNTSFPSFDPTLMLNGQYEMQLVAWDANGDCGSDSHQFNVMYHQKVGLFTVSYNDLTIPFAGMPITITRTYDSRLKSGGDFGIGWTLGIANIRLQRSGAVGDNWCEVTDWMNYTVQPDEGAPHLITITLPDDTVYAFQAQLAQPTQMGENITQGTLVYTPLPGTHATLTDNNTGAVLVVGDGDWSGSNPAIQLVTLQDLDGNSYDPTTFTLTTRDGRQFTFDASTGNITTIKDRIGNTLTIARDANNNVTGVMAANVNALNNSKAVLISYNGAYISSIKDPNGNSLQYTNMGGDLVSVTDRAGNTSTYDYDSQHNLLHMYDAAGHPPVTNRYDPVTNRLTETDDALGNKTAFTYGPATVPTGSLTANQEMITDPRTYPTILTYDAFGNVTGKTQYTGFNVLGQPAFPVTTTSAFGDSANPNLPTETSVTLKDGRTPTSHFTYDGVGNLLESEDPNENKTEYKYNNFGQQTDVYDAKGIHTAHNEYDPATGSLLSTTDGNGNTVQYAFNQDGTMSASQDARGKITNYAYADPNNPGRPTAIKSPLGAVTQFAYDLNGNRVARAVTRTGSGGPQTLVTGFSHDVNDNVTGAVAPATADGISHSQTIYNSLNQVSESIDAEGRLTTYGYDADGRQILVVHPDGGQDQTVYDASGNPSVRIDPCGHVTRTLYDGLNRPYEADVLPSSQYLNGQSTDPLGNTLTPLSKRITTYDNDGSVLSVTDENDNPTTYAYDLRHEVARMIVAQAAA